MKKFLIGLVVAVLVITGFAGNPVFAVSNEVFKQSNNVEFSSADAARSLSGNFVYYSQKDPRWANTLYGSNGDGVTIFQAGCAPTSLAMIIATFTNPSITPVEVANAGYENNSLLIGVGTVHEPLIQAAEKKGWIDNRTFLASESIEEVMRFVEAGGLVYMSGRGPAPFTGEGHIVVIRDVDMSAGTITIADPWRGEADVYTKEVVDTYRSDVVWGITK
jgi:hypothetical protein